MTTEDANTAVRTMPEWTTNTSPQEICDRVRALGRVALLTHARPDGDAVGGTLAMARTLARVGVQATPVYLDPWPSRFDDLVDGTDCVFEHERWQDDPRLQNLDAVIVIDTGSWNQLGPGADLVTGHADRTILIDHHPYGDADVASFRWIDTAAAAACEQVAAIACLLLGVQGPASLPADIASPLYLGIATDTGWFRYSNTSPDTLRIAADLMQAGADANAIYRQIEQNDSMSRVRLLARALASLRISDDGRVAIMRISRADFQETGATLDETGGFTDLPQTVASVRAVAVCVELDDALTKISLRSKAGERSIDVATIAHALGGGGHRHAAGIRISRPLDEAASIVERALLDGAEE